MSNTLNKIFGNFVREKRLALGWSQAELAEKIYGERNRQNICAIEKGRRNITLETADFILQALQVKGVRFEE